MVFHSNSLLPCSSLLLGSLCQQHCRSGSKVWDFSALGFLPSHCPLWHSKLRGTTCTAFTDPHFALLPFITFYLLSSQGCGLESAQMKFCCLLEPAPGKPPRPLVQPSVAADGSCWERKEVEGHSPSLAAPRSVCLCLLPHQTMKISFTIISLQFSVPPG